MRKRSAQVAVAVATVGFLTACGGSPDSAGAKGGRDRGVPQRVKLDGCVLAAPGVRQYVLQDVVTPEIPEQPTSNESLSRGRLIPDGSWVRLARGGDDLGPFLGKHVEIEGNVTDTGEPTMGTSGGDDREKLRRSSPDASSTTDRSVPPSTVPPHGANANGLAPLVAVERIRTLADKCPTEHEKAAEGHTGLGGRRRAPAEDNPGPGSHR